MKNLTWIGRCFYGIGIAGMGIQQFIYSEFRPVILPYWPSSFPSMAVSAWVVGAILILAGAIICFSKNARTISLALGIFFFLFFVCFHVYYHLFVSPQSFQLGLWTNPLKELAFAGSAFIIAVSYNQEKTYTSDKLFLITGRVFFSIMLIVFGIDHFLYTDFVATLVPRWIPGDRFWTYFAAVALIGSGLCILLKIKIRLVAFLLAIMLFLWWVLLHIPRAINTPHVADKGNEITSVCQALAFCGVALVIAELYRNKRVEKK